MAPLSEQSALAWLCRELPRLRVAAERDGWSARLEKIVQSVLDGGLASVACTKLGHDPSRVPRETGGPAIPALGSLGIAAVPVIGEYRCPRSERPCDRSAGRGDSGEEPRCAWEGGAPLEWRPTTGTAA